MTALDHSVRAHALLSASSADRWLNCPPSARLNDLIKDEGSVFAAEGTKAHELGELCLTKRKNADDIEGDYPQVMRDYVQMYVDYVRDIKGHLLIEQRLDFTTWAPEGFGTSDGVALDNGHMHIIDLKYGKGIRVDAEMNYQLMLYALGAYAAYDCIYGPLTKVTLHIVQPRLDHFDAWTISVDDLLAWGESIKPIAALAYAGKGDFKCGDHCVFCGVRHTCRTRADFSLKTVGDMSIGAELTNEELAAIYPKLDGIVRWANDLESYCLARAEAGTQFAGLKLVEGRSSRRITDDKEAMTRFEKLGFEPEEFLTMKLIGIGDAEKLVGKKEFAEKFGDIVIKPIGKPTLVAATDKRPAISAHDAALKDLLSS